MSDYERWICLGAERAAKKARSAATRTFFRTLATTLGAPGTERRAGNRRVIESAIGSALGAALTASSSAKLDIKGSTMVALSRGPLARKEVDASITSPAGRYLIEQKTIFRNNAFFEVAYQGWLLRRGVQGSAKYVGLFHHSHCSLARSGALIADAKKHGMLDEVYILAPDPSRNQGDAAEYDPAVIDRLIADVKAFHRNRKKAG